MWSSHPLWGVRQQAVVLAFAALSAAGDSEG
jgi:hypothetical protein